MSFQYFLLHGSYIHYDENGLLSKPCNSLTCDEYYKGIFIFNLTVLARFFFITLPINKCSGIDAYTIQSPVQSTVLTTQHFRK